MWKWLEGIRDWALDSVPNTVVTIATSAAFAYLASHFDEVCEIAAARSRAFVSAMLFSLALGVFCAFMSGGVESYVEGRREERARRYAEADAAEKRRLDEEAASRDKAERARRLILGLEPWLKRYLHHLRSEGGSVVTRSVSDRTILEELYPIHELLERTRVSGDGGEHVWRVSLNDFGNYVVDECNDLLEEAVAHDAGGEK